MSKLEKVSLLSSKEDARKKIEAQIEKGTELLGRKIVNKPELRAAEHEEDRWTDFNIQLCNELFSNDSVASEFVKHRSRAFTSEDTFQESEAYFRRRIESQLNTLTSINDRLNIIPIAEKKSGAAAVVEALPMSMERTTFRREVESHPIGYAAVLVVATAVITAGFMGWVQVNRVDTITTRCETEKTGIRNDYDSQIRELKAQIQELKGNKAK